MLDAVIFEGYDDKANVLGVKGLGELGICGAGAAIGNAVFNATGVRVPDFPVTLEKLLPALPKQGSTSISPKRWSETLSRLIVRRAS